MKCRYGIEAELKNIWPCQACFTCEHTIKPQENEKKVFCIACSHVQKSEAAKFMHKGDLVLSESCENCGKQALEVIK